MPPESQLLDTELRLRVRERIVSGVLPVMGPVQLLAGYGLGFTCIACDEPITPAQVEYEIKNPKGERRLRFHLGCYFAWEAECAKARLHGGSQSQPT